MSYLLSPSLSIPKSDVVHFYINVKPFGKQRHGQNGMTGACYTPKKTKEYESLIAYTAFNAMQKAGVKKIEGRAIEVDLFMFYKVPESYSKKRQELLAAGRPLVKPDTDNVLKIVMDGLTGIAYDDDCIVVDNIVRKVYASEWGIGVRFHEV
jgi:Holliday junction resolvase RusA-like endonuclease